MSDEATQNPVPETTSSPTNPPEAVVTPESSTSVETSLPNEPADAEAKADKQTAPAESETAQIPVNEPLETKSEPLNQAQSKPVENPSLARELFAKARNAIQFRKRKKLDKIMTLFDRSPQITNDEVEKLLRVSDATATRYLSILEKEGKIKQNGRTGKGVSYSKM